MPQGLADGRRLVSAELKLRQHGVGRPLEVGHEFRVDHRPPDEVA